MDDPLTDRVAAEKFTAAHRYSATSAWDRRSEPHPFCTWPSMEGKPRCQGSCLDTSSRFHRRYQCEKAAKITTADGATWCGIHGPSAVAKREANVQARRDRQLAIYEFQNNRAAMAREREKAYPILIASLQQIADGHNDATALARQTLASLPEALRPKKD